MDLRLAVATAASVIAFSGCTLGSEPPIGTRHLEILPSGKARLESDVLRPDEVGRRLEALLHQEPEGWESRGPILDVTIDPDAPFGAVEATVQQLRAILKPEQLTWSGVTPDLPPGVAPFELDGTARDFAYVSLDGESIRASSGREKSASLQSPAEVEEFARALVAQNPEKAFTVKIDDAVRWQRSVDVFEALLRARAQTIVVLRPAIAISD